MLFNDVHKGLVETNPGMAVDRNLDVKALELGPAKKRKEEFRFIRYTENMLDDYYKRELDGFKNNQDIAAIVLACNWKI